MLIWLLMETIQFYYTVVDTTGNKSFAQLNVTVKTPQEVIDNKIEEERRAKRK